jgi:hypothetical protein
VFPQRPSPTDPDLAAADIILQVRRVFGRDGDPIQTRLTPPRLMMGFDHQKNNLIQFLGFRHLLDFFRFSTNNRCDFAVCNKWFGAG